MAVQGLLAAGAILAGVGVVLGAFGAHGLESRLTADDLHVWNTAVQYQLLHALAIVAVAILGQMQPGIAAPVVLGIAGWAFVAGVVLFSGTLYVLALGGPRVLGPVTPVGGAALVIGWVALAVAALR